MIFDPKLKLTRTHLNPPLQAGLDSSATLAP